MLTLFLFSIKVRHLTCWIHESVTIKCWSFGGTFLILILIFFLSFLLPSGPSLTPKLNLLKLVTTSLSSIDDCNCKARLASLILSAWFWTGHLFLFIGFGIIMKGLVLCSGFAFWFWFLLSKPSKFYITVKLMILGHNWSSSTMQ